MEQIYFRILATIVNWHSSNLIKETINPTISFYSMHRSIGTRHERIKGISKDSGNLRAIERKRNATQLPRRDILIEKFTYKLAHQLACGAMY